jgi:hypothetical protein
MQTMPGLHRLRRSIPSDDVLAYPRKSDLLFSALYAAITANELSEMITIEGSNPLDRHAYRNFDSGPTNNLFILATQFSEVPSTAPGEGTSDRIEALAACNATSISTLLAEQHHVNGSAARSLK